MEEIIKEWIDQNVHDETGKQLLGPDFVKFTPLELEELIFDMYDDIIKPVVDKQKDE